MITASAPGKINLYFGVGPKLANGYHSVCSVYLALDLRESVSVDFAESFGIEVNGSLSKEHLDSVPTGNQNLVAISAASVTSDTLRFVIKKDVPVAGGMGGGSADAAAALIATIALTGKTSDVSSVTLGADVPFSLLGGVALGTGIGEVLKPLKMTTDLHVVLITSKEGLSTPAVYQRLDDLRAADGLIPDSEPLVPVNLIEALEQGDLQNIAHFAHNDLQRAALSLKPELQKSIDLALQAGALCAMVSGSGPTVFALAENRSKAQAIAANFGPSAIVTKGPSGPARLES